MATAKGKALQLTNKPEIVTWPETHYAYLEKIGPFEDTAQPAWKELQQLIPAISEHNKITGYTSFYKMEAKIYRAGVSVRRAQEFAGRLAIFKIQRRRVQPFCVDRTVLKSARSFPPGFPNGLRPKNPDAR